MNVQELAVSSVYPNQDQPRKEFNQAALEELAASIGENGLLQPIRVRRTDRGFMIICGERRWRAHCHLGSETVSAVVTDATEEEMADQAIIENLQRKDIKPLEEARAFQARLDAGLSVEELARRLGVRQPWRITERTNLLKLSPEYQDAFEKGLLNPSQCQEMSRLNHAFQSILFAAIRDGKCQSYQEVRAATLNLLFEQNRNPSGSAFRLGAERDTQSSMFDVPEPTAAEKSVVRAMERKIELVEALLRGGIHENEIVICRKVDTGKADLMAEKLRLIEKQLAKMRVALVASAVRATMPG